MRGDMLFTKHRLCSINYMQGVRISAALGRQRAMHCGVGARTHCVCCAVSAGQASCAKLRTVCKCFVVSFYACLLACFTCQLESQCNRVLSLACARFANKCSLASHLPA